MCEEMVGGALRLGAMTPGEFVRGKNRGDYKQNPVLKEMTRKGAKEKIRGIVRDREWENQASIEETMGNMFQGEAVVRPTKNKTENV